MNAQRLEKPNKPMVPTATTSLNEYTPSSPRQHIGQPLGSEQRAMKASKNNASVGARDMCDKRKSESWPASCVLRATYAVVILVSSLALAACSSLSAGGQHVQYTSNPNEVSNCRPLGNVTATPPYGLPDDWKNQLRNRTAERGGNRVYSPPPGIGAVEGQAYHCGN